MVSISNSWFEKNFSAEIYGKHWWTTFLQRRLLRSYAGQFCWQHQERPVSWMNQTSMAYVLIICLAFLVKKWFKTQLYFYDIERKTNFLLQITIELLGCNPILSTKHWFFTSLLTVFNLCQCACHIFHAWCKLYKKGQGQNAIYRVRSRTGVSQKLIAPPNFCLSNTHVKKICKNRKLISVSWKSTCSTLQHMQGVQG